MSEYLIYECLNCQNFIALPNKDGQSCPKCKGHIVARRQAKQDEIKEYKNPQRNNVIKPPHYTDKNIEVIDYIKDTLTPEQYTGYCAGNVFKYISRYRKKNGIEDLLKAKVYLDWLIEVEE